MDWFYYDDKGERIGPITIPQLREMVRLGFIKRETFIENANGRSSKAGNIKGLDFPPEAERTSFCSFCEKELINPNAVICPHCGVAVGKARVSPTGPLKSWSVGERILFTIIAFFCPPAGWIIGGKNLNRKKYTEARRFQAIVLIFIATSSFFTFLFFLFIFIAAGS
jgi:hypothetical protein